MIPGRKQKDKNKQYVIVRTLVKQNVLQPFFVLKLPGWKYQM
jgi:hypothetical protein